MTFAGEELYPTITDKASALGFSLIQNHAFVDGNKRVGHAALELFLVLNGFQLEAELEEQVSTVLQVASSHLSREEFRNWITKHLVRWP